MTGLAGKTVIVTGASRGIGAAAAIALGAAGASVMLTARSGEAAQAVAEEITRNGGTARAMTCDVASYETIAAVAEETRRRFGKVDVLVNNAGVIDPIAMIAESDPAEWAKGLGINLTGAYNAVRAVLPGMIAAGGGRIINISSGAALNPLEGWSAYCVGKAGLAMLTRAITLEAGAAGVIAFGFAPGTCDTDMQVTIRASGVNRISRIPREELTPVDQPARTIVYLSTPAADDLAGGEISLRDPGLRRRVGLE